METLWDKVKKSVMDGVNAAAEKTEELTKLGKMKLEILNIKHKISKQFTELGGIVFDAVKTEKTKDVMKSDEFQAIIKSLNELEADLIMKEKTFDEMKNKEN
jgi:mannitol-1-phosphate/altronate dehydrogenase